MENDKRTSLTLASIICRGSTLAIIGFVIASNYTDHSIGRIAGMIVGYILGTLLKKYYTDNH
ncbi:MAG: hypothetical protein KH921_06920 [Erysipelotrichaceae bacterium]|nr:hypothetical protein [Erysipelotrichaceae bacterium]